MCACLAPPRCHHRSGSLLNNVINGAWSAARASRVVPTPGDPPQATLCPRRSISGRNRPKLYDACRVCVERADFGRKLAKLGTDSGGPECLLACQLGRALGSLEGPLTPSRLHPHAGPSAPCSPPPRPARGITTRSSHESLCKSGRTDLKQVRWEIPPGSHDDAQTHAGDGALDLPCLGAWHRTLALEALAPSAAKPRGL